MVEMMACLVGDVGSLVGGTFWRRVGGKLINVRTGLRWRHASPRFTSGRLLAMVAQLTIARRRNE